MPANLNRNYRILVIILFVSLLVFGIAFLLLTNSFLQALKPSAQKFPEQTPFNKELLLLGITMVAGLPAVGIGTYLAYLGNQMRVKSSIPQTNTGERLASKIPKGSLVHIRGPLLMVSGGFIILCALALPLVVWWMSD